MMISLINSKRLSKRYNTYIADYEKNNLFIYSYWCNDSALALAFLNNSNKNIIRANDVQRVTTTADDRDALLDELRRHLPDAKSQAQLNAIALQLQYN